MSFTKDAEKEEFKHWLALPTASRVPAQQKDWAERHGVDQATLSRWKKDPEFMEEVRALRKEPLRDRLADILKTLGDKAEKGDVRAIELVLKYIEDHVEKKEVRHVGPNGNSFVSMGPEFWNFLATQIALHPKMKASGMSQGDVEKVITDSISSLQFQA